MVWHSLRHNTNITIFHTDKQLFKLEKKIVNILKSIQKDCVNLKAFKPRKDYQKSTLCNWCPVWDECSAKVGHNPSFDNLIKQFNIKLNNVAIEYNNKIIDKKKIKKIMLKNKDFIEVVHFIGGG